MLNSLKELKTKLLNLVFLDVFGCQMNVSDAEVVWSVLESKGYQRTLVKSEADVLLVVTCSIREGAEAKVWNSLLNVQNRIQFGQFKKSMVVGLLGCMAERLKDKMLSTPQKLVDLVAGPGKMPIIKSCSKCLKMICFRCLPGLAEAVGDH